MGEEMEKRARELLADHGRYPSGGPVPYDTAVRAIAAALDDGWRPVELTEAQIDAAAKHLRETHGAGKRLTPWSDTPKATKKKWLILGESTLRAAMTSPTPNGSDGR